MNAGRDLYKASQQAAANASRDGKPRYMHQQHGDWWIDRTPPNGAFGDHPYYEVNQDGKLIPRHTSTTRKTVPCGSCGERPGTIKVKYADDSGVGSMLICNQCEKRS